MMNIINEKKMIIKYYVKKEYEKHMKEYIEFVANRLVKELQYDDIYPDSKNPFPFMEIRNLEDVTNFFDKRSNSYKRKVIMDYTAVDNNNEQDLNFDLDDVDF